MKTSWNPHKQPKAISAQHVQYAIVNMVSITRRAGMASTQRPELLHVAYPKYGLTTSCSLAAVGLFTGMLLCQPVEAAPLLPQELVLLDSGNSAIMQSLKQYSKTRERFGSQEPTAVLSSRFQGVQQQLQRIELLVKIGQYDNARMALREGAFKSLRMDLGYGQEMYRVVKPEAVREVVEGVELLDRQLRSREPIDVIKPQLQQLQTQLGNMAELLTSLGQ